MEKKQLEEAIDDIAEGLGFAATVDTGDTDGKLVVGELPPDTSTPTVEGEAKPPETIIEETAKTGEPAAEPSLTPDPATVTPEETRIPPPKTWRPEAVKDWDSLPASVKAEVAKREEDMFKGIESYKQDAGIGKSLRDVMEPYISQLQSAGIHPLAQIKNLMHSHHVLVNGSQEQRNQVFHHLAKEYGVTLDASGDLPYVDPQIADLNKTIDDLRSRLDTNDQRTADSVREQLKTEIDAFAADPKNKQRTYQTPTKKRCG